MLEESNIGIFHMEKVVQLGINCFLAEEITSIKSKYSKKTFKITNKEKSNQLESLTSLPLLTRSLQFFLGYSGSF